MIWKSFFYRPENLPWYAPQNQIPLFPWILSNSSEAFDAAMDGTGWPVDHLSKVCFGVWSGFRVTRKGRLVSSIFCMHNYSRVWLEKISISEMLIIYSYNYGCLLISSLPFVSWYVYEEALYVQGNIILSRWYSILTPISVK